ncbi:MAG: hypothetical protein A2Y16_06595 [Tenericutes bacterium GWF2_57_13]|nr:MAG: hypothetical protein A2Y16_06595 [Tenericutes bacterium GWF2_57_13]
MKDELVKSYDIMMELQNKVDTKAQIFIAILTSVVSFFWGIQQLSAFSNITEGYQLAVYLLLLPVFFFVLSLVPVYMDRFAGLFRKQKDTSDIVLNLFYWTSISEFKNAHDFISSYQTLYAHPQLSPYEDSILKQIKVNANILCRKVTYHRIAFFLLVQDLLFTGSIVIYYILHGTSPLLYIVILVIIEAAYLVGMVMNHRIEKKH